MTYRHDTAQSALKDSQGAQVDRTYGGPAGQQCRLVCRVTLKRAPRRALIHALGQHVDAATALGFALKTRVVVGGAGPAGDGIDAVKSFRKHVQTDTPGIVLLRHSAAPGRGDRPRSKVLCCTHPLAASPASTRIT